MTEYPSVLDVEVTKADIRQGKKNHCTTCPVALAMRRTVRDLGLPDTTVVSVGVNTAWLYEEDEDEHVKPGAANYKFPDDAFRFICAFDRGHDVLPFTFMAVRGRVENDGSA